VVPGPGQGGETQRLGRLPAGSGHGTYPAFQVGHTFLEGGHRWVGDAGVDVAILLQREEVGGVGGVLENEAGGLVNGDRPHPGGGVWPRPRVQSSGPEPEGPVRAARRHLPIL
jgi:hypothetical protein